MFDLCAVRVNQESGGLAGPIGPAMLAVEATLADADDYGRWIGASRSTIDARMGACVEAWRKRPPAVQLARLQGRLDAERERQAGLKGRAAELAEKIRATFVADNDPTELERKRFQVVADLDGSEGRQAMLTDLIARARTEAEADLQRLMLDDLGRLREQAMREKQAACAAVVKALSAHIPALLMSENTIAAVVRDKQQVLDYHRPAELAPEPTPEPDFPPESPPDPEADRRGYEVHDIMTPRPVPAGALEAD
jgi:hypothetical protein